MTSGMRVALGALVAAVALVGWTALRAIRIDPVPDASAATIAGGALNAAASRPTPADVKAAVENDPFSPDRTAPAERYRMPGDPIPAPGGPPPATPDPVLLGTAVGDSAHSFITCRLGDGPPVILRIGEKIGIYTLKSIERGRAVFVSAAGKRLEVRALTSE